MSARGKLNQAHTIGILVLSGVVAAQFRSWLVFAVLAGILVVLALTSGDIRLKPRQ